MEVKPVIHANVICTMKAIIAEAPRLGTEDKIVDQVCVVLRSLVSRLSSLVSSLSRVATP